MDASKLLLSENKKNHLENIYRDIYVTVNLYNQVICILPDVFS